MRSECGARGRNDTVRSRAALGIMLAGITTGPGGAFPGLGQAGAGNARLAARSLSPPGWGELDKTMRSRRIPGSLAWSCAQRAKAPDGKSRGGTPTDERVPLDARRAQARRMDTYACRRSASFCCLPEASLKEILS
jgi:hypothetical protein